jgi:hypothetical protein
MACLLVHRARLEASSRAADSGLDSDFIRRLLDHLVLDGGEEWEIPDFIDEWTAGAEEGDRGPQVVCLPGEDGRLAVVAKDELGYLAETVAVLVPVL